MTSKKFPHRWGGDLDKFQFNAGGRPAVISKEPAKKASKKEALAEQLKNVLGNEKK